MKTKGKIFDDYLNEVRKYFPRGFEDSMRDEGLGPCVTAYLAVSFMGDEDAQKCAELVIEKLGIEE